MGCPLCEEIENKKNIIYEDSLCVAFLHPTPTVKGHMIITSRKHYPIIEQVPNNEIEHCFFVANKASILAFEGLKVQGTNILVNNGIAAGQTIPHFHINVLPRTENDGLDFNFQRNQAQPDVLKTIQSKLKECADLIGHSPVVPVSTEEQEEIESIAENEEENYLIQQLTRIP